MGANPSHIEASGETLVGTSPSLLQQLQERIRVLEDQVKSLSTVPNNVRQPLTVEAPQQNNEQRTNNDKDAPPGFPQFPRLPLELRHHIWKMCIPRRKLHVFNGLNRVNSKIPRSMKLGLPPPVISKELPKPAGIEPLFWTWFDGAHDILELDESSYPGAPGAPNGFDKILRRSEAILLRGKDLEYSWVYHAFQEELDFDYLQTIYVAPGGSQIVRPMIWTPEVVSKLLDIHSVLLIDLDDSERLTAVDKYLEEVLDYDQYDFEIWLRLWREEVDQERYLAKIDTILKTAWAVMPQWGLPTDAMPALDFSEPKVKDRIAKMRPIKSVFVFELEDERYLPAPERCYREPSDDLDYLWDPWDYE